MLYCLLISLTIFCWFYIIIFSELVEGDSGSIVYFVGEKVDGQCRHYPWGMLVEKQHVPRAGDQPEYDVYIAVVLDQVFKDIQKDYRNNFNNLGLYHIPR